jgi:FkbM family methyltransferase
MLKNVKIDKAAYVVSSDDDYLSTVGNEFEPHMVQLFRSLIGPDDVVADIGANIGLTALLFSTLAKKTYAFEPSPSTYRILSENLARNQVENVEPINLGLGRKQETLTITFAANNRSGGYVSDKIRPEDGHITEEIQIAQIDQLFPSKGIAATFMKIDVEGFEMNVVGGASQFLAEHRPTVVMEMNHFCLGVLQRITIPDFLDFMRSVFPYLYAVDADNRTVVNLHLPDEAYGVMHEHVVKQRFPNIVGAFDPAIEAKLESLATAANNQAELLKSRKTPAIVNPAGSIHTAEPVPQVHAGGRTEIKVRVSNTGLETWHAEGEHPVLLCYHWKKPDGDMDVFDGVRTRLVDAEVASGSTFEQAMTISSPGEKGAYRLVLTLVQEGVCWFEDRGFGSAELDVEVV